MKIIDIFYKNKIKKGCMYAITCGKHMGNFILFLGNPPILENHTVIMLPDITFEKIPQKDIEDGIDKGILEFVTKLGKSVYEATLEQANLKMQKEKEKEIEASDEYFNRREQFTTQGVLDIPK